VILQAVEKFKYGTTQDLDTYVAAMGDEWYYQRRVYVKTTLFTKYYNLNYYAIQKWTMQESQVCNMYYNVTNPVYMNITIENYATTVDSSLEGITYLKLN